MLNCENEAEQIGRMPQPTPIRKFTEAKTELAILTYSSLSSAESPLHFCIQKVSNANGDMGQEIAKYPLHWLRANNGDSRNVP